jgi:hypothetical protein
MQRRPGPIRRPDPESDLSFPPPFAQQAKYLALADQFLALETTRKDKSDGKATNLRKHFMHTKKAA